MYLDTLWLSGTVQYVQYLQDDANKFHAAYIYLIVYQIRARESQENTSVNRALYDLYYNRIKLQS
jgi:hypothetical protein